MNSEVSISSMALTRLGQARISSMTQKGLGAELSNQYYETTRDELISDYDWPFAIKRESIAVSADTNLSNFTYMYTLPTDYLRVLTLLSSEDYSEIKDAWQIEGLKLLTDINPAYIKYIRKVENPVELPQLFVEAFYLRMATKMCIKLTQDEKLLIKLWQEFGTALLIAKGNQGSSGRQDQVADSLWSD